MAGVTDSSTSSSALPLSCLMMEGAWRPPFQDMQCATAASSAERTCKPADEDSPCKRNGGWVCVSMVCEQKDRVGVQQGSACRASLFAVQRSCCLLLSRRGREHTHLEQL